MGYTKHLYFKSKQFKHVFNLVLKQHCLQCSTNSISKYNSDLEAVINKQIQSELQAGIEYLNLAVHFLHPKISYIGTGGYFMKMYREELHHMEMLINYQLIRGGIPTTRIGKEHTDTHKHNLTIVAAFTQALEMEKTITKQLENVVSTAEAVRDVQCADFITSKFLEEQIRAIHELSQHVTTLNRLSNNNHALWNYDRMLLKLTGYKGL